MAKRSKKIEEKSRLQFLELKGKEFSKDLRRRATTWEKQFKVLLDKAGVEYIFQYPVICNKKKLYIVDFYIPKYKLAIELDGSGHYTESGISKDKRRTSALLKEGIRVHRFTNKAVKSITCFQILNIIEDYAA